MSRLRPIVLEILTEAREEGRTWREVSEILRYRYLADGSHGSVSSVLSTLDKAGRIVRLAEKRERCSVYVLPEHAGDRPVATSRGISSNGWLAGYDAGVDETTKRLARTQEPPPDSTSARRRGVEEGRRLARLDALRYVEVLLAEGSKGQPAYVHNKTCWQQHPMCALLAVKKNLTIGD